MSGEKFNFDQKRVLKSVPSLEELNARLAKEFHTVNEEEIVYLDSIARDDDWGSSTKSVSFAIVLLPDGRIVQRTSSTEFTGSGRDRHQTKGETKEDFRLLDKKNAISLLESEIGEFDRREAKQMLEKIKHDSKSVPFMQ